MPLTETQQLVLDELAAGASIRAAAGKANVHRNTVHNWLRHDTPFFFYLQGAFQAQSAEARAQMHEHVPAAQETIRLILSGELGTPALRLRTALAVLKFAMAPVAEYVETKYVYPQPTADQVAAAARAEQLHNETAAAQSLHNPPPEQTAQSLHNPAKPIPIRREGPKIARNELCPCGSGRKYKFCCLNQRTTAAQLTSAA